MLITCDARANPNIRAAFFTFYPSAVGTKLDSVASRSGHCGACHYDFKNGGSPWNPYGQSIKDVGGLNSTSGRSNAIWTVRLQEQDGDSFNSQMEITNRIYPNAPTFPGLSAANLSQVLNVTLSDIQTNLAPSATVDSTPPAVTVSFPNGGESITANRPTNVTWSASDASGVAAVHIYLSLDNGSTYAPVALGLANSGAYTWYPANRPSTTARIRVVAVDGAANSTNDISNAAFTIVSPPGGRVPTTLRDFDLPGTQPFEGGSDLAAPENCATCHGNYSQTAEPYFNWQGSMMAHASRDPLFLANFAIANQDAPDSGDLCIRCHFPRGWLAGRSVPTDASRIQAADKIGVSCDLCHRMVDPVYSASTSVAGDSNIIAALSFKGTNYGNGMFVVDPSTMQRGPYTNPAAPHSFAGSAFHRSAAFCGTCHDVSNPVFTKDGQGTFQPNAFNAASTNFSPHSMGTVERTYSEWLASAFNSSNGVFAPRFAGNKTNGIVSTCQDCHMRDVAGQGANPSNNAGVPMRTDLPLHDMTGGSTWIPALLTNLFPAEVSAPAIRAGIARATTLLQNAADLGISDTNGRLKVTITNQCGHKLPTGYPEGRRMWINVQFYDEATNLVSESGAYNATNGVLNTTNQPLSYDAAARVYEVHPGINTNISGVVGLPADASLHFVLNNRIYVDDRIPPRGFTNSTFAQFGGAPVMATYADGQYWDETSYTIPPGATRAEVRLYYQSTSKEFVEFLRDENFTNTKGQEMYDLWRTNGMCPPTLMTSAQWVPAFVMKSAQFTGQGRFRMEFLARPGVSYTIEFKDSLNPGATWQTFAANGTCTATNTLVTIEDDFTGNTSRGPSPTGQRYYRFRYTTQ